MPTLKISSSFSRVPFDLEAFIAESEARQKYIEERAQELPLLEERIRELHQEMLARRQPLALLIKEEKRLLALLDEAQGSVPEPAAELARLRELLREYQARVEEGRTSLRDVLQRLDEAKRRRNILRAR